jgi:hypothetical protein
LQPLWETGVNVLEGIEFRILKEAIEVFKKGD